LEISNTGALAAEVPLGAGVFFISPYLEDPAAFGENLETAVAVTKHARSFFPVAHDFLLL
jgi:hypothetical protein